MGAWKLLGKAVQRNAGKIAGAATVGVVGTVLTGAAMLLSSFFGESMKSVGKEAAHDAMDE